MSPTMRPGVRGHTVPNLIRQRQRLFHLIKRNGVLIRAQGAYIAALKGQATVRHRGETLTTHDALLEQIRQMKVECQLIHKRLAERDESLACAQIRVKELEMDYAQLAASLTRRAP